MENIKKDCIFLNKSNVLQFLNSQKFGSVQVAFEDLEAQKLLEHGIIVCNKINRGSVYYKEDVEEKAEDVYNEKKGTYKTKWTAHEIPNRFRVYFTREYKVGSIGDDDFYIELIATKSIESGIDFELNINEKMHIEAKKIAKLHGIKIETIGDKIFFKNKKNDSIFESLKKACKSNDLKIEFDASQTSIHTIRAYCSILKKQTIKDLRCKIEPGKIVVYFRELSTKERLLSDLENCLKLMVVNEVPEYEIKSVIDSVLMPEWQQKGFACEQDYIDHIFDQELALRTDFDDDNQEF